LQFLNPVALLGLAAALIPLAIHLLHRGSTRPVPFSNLAFLQRLHHSRMRRVRLRQWLVLLLRTLIIALLVCAFGRPAYRAGGGWTGRAMPVAAAVLLDLSYSTGYRLPSGQLFAQLEHQAGEVLGLFSGRDQVAVIPFADRPLETLNGAPERLRERLRELIPTQAATDLRPALRAAAQHLEAHPGLDRELFLLTDLSRHNWLEVEGQRTAFAQTRVYLSAPEAGSRPNAHIDGVRLPSWMPVAGEKLILQAEVAGSGLSSRPAIALDLFVEGERVQHQSLDLVQDAGRPVELKFAPRHGGRLAGYAELEDDGLALDNRRYFAIDIPSTIAVLVLGPEPGDTYYPRRALGAASLSDPALELRSGLLGELNAELIQGAKVLVLCNVERLTPAQLTLLGDFAAQGGGLILFPAPMADLNHYNRDLLPGLVPALLKDVVGSPADKGSFQLLDPDAPHHLLFAQLLARHAEDRPRFYARFVLLPRNHLQPLIHFDDGQIALAQAWKERGRVVLAAFPLDLEWNDLPLKGLFAPLLHRLVRELSLPADRHATYLVGQTVHRYLEGVPVEAPIEAESPSGDRLRLEPERVAGQYRWKIPRVHEAGHWRLWRGEEQVDLFAVNVDARESDLSLVDQEYLAELFGRENLHFLRPGDDLRLKVLGNRYGRELWREFLALAAVLLLLELWIARAPRDRLPERRAGAYAD
jgi:hypothetical protein